MPFFITLGQDDTHDKKQKKLQETRIARIKEMRRIDSERRKEMMKWYQQEAQHQESDLREYYARCRQVEQQGALLAKALEEQAWANAPNSRDEAEYKQNYAKQEALKKRQLQQLRLKSQKQRAQEAIDIIVRQEAEENINRLKKKQRDDEYQEIENKRRKKVIDQQKFREQERKKYMLEEELYRDTLEYKLHEKQGATFTEIIKEDQIPLQINKNCRKPGVTIIAEQANDHPNMSGVYSADAYVEAANKQNNPTVKTYPTFDYNKYNQRQHIDKLAAEGLSILDAISKM